MVEAVTDVDDPRIAEYKAIPDPDLMRRRGLFVAEGRRVVRRALESQWAVRSVFLTPAAERGLSDAIAASRVKVFVAAQPLLNSVAGFNFHRGCLALVERPAPVDCSSLLGLAGSRRLVVLDQIANADNIGGIFRNAAAFGADGVLLGPGCNDPLYRKALRTSMGAALSVPFARFTAWPALGAGLRACGWTVVALTPESGGLDIERYRESCRDSRLALLLGSEESGLCEAARQVADLSVRISMASGVDSLNVATAAGIALHALAGE